MFSKQIPPPLPGPGPCLLDHLIHEDCLTPPDCPTLEHHNRLVMCVEAGRHTPAFNSWLTAANVISFTLASHLDEGSPLLTLHDKLCAIDAPLANAAKQFGRSAMVQRIVEIYTRL